jgi:hypothetical protein
MRLALQFMIKKKFRTQRAFAKACGRSDEWISKIIIGIRNPSEREKRLIADKLNADYGDELFMISVVGTEKQ